MYACMLPASHPYAVWVINPSVLPDLIGMISGDAAPAAASNPIWINRDMGAQNPIPGRIFGRPFIISRKNARARHTGRRRLFRHAVLPHFRSPANDNRLQFSRCFHYRRGLLEICTQSCRTMLATERTNAQKCGCTSDFDISLCCTRRRHKLRSRNGIQRQNGRIQVFR